LPQPRDRAEAGRRAGRPAFRSIAAERPETVADPDRTLVRGAGMPRGRSTRAPAVTAHIYRRRPPPTRHPRITGASRRRRDSGALPRSGSWRTSNRPLAGETRCRATNAALAALLFGAAAALSPGSEHERRPAGGRVDPTACWSRHAGAERPIALDRIASFRPRASP
jgi:hypothetical protein